MEQDISQISRSNNISASRSETYVLDIGSANLGFKFKPDRTEILLRVNF